VLQTFVRRNSLTLVFTIIVGLVLVAYPSGAEPQLTLFAKLAVFFSCTLLFAITLQLVDGRDKRYWTGYLALAVHVAWLTLDLKPALAVIIGATLLHVLLSKIRHREHTDLITLLTSHLSVSGLQVIVAYLVYTRLFVAPLPFVTLTPNGVVAMMSALVAGYVTAQVIGMTVTAQTINLRDPDAKGRLLLDVLLIWLIPVLPAIAHSLGSISFVIIMTLTTLQAIRYYQISAARTQIVQNSHQMTALSTLGKTFSNDLDPEMLIDQVYHAVDELVSPQTFFIALYDNDQKQINYLSVIQKGKRVVWPTRHLQNGLTDYIIREQCPLLLSNGTVKKMESLGIKPQEFTSAAYAGVPLMVSTRVIGVMGVMDEKDLHAYDDSTIDILTTIAGQTSLAIRNATLYERNMTLADNLTLINQSLQDIMFNLDQETALKRAVQIAQQIVNADKTALFLIDTDSTNLLTVVQSIGIEHPEHLQTEFKPDLYRGGARVINDINMTGDAQAIEHAQQIGFQSVLEVPLRSGNTIVGYMAAYHLQPYSYQQQEIQLMEMLTNQITAALDNAELLRALEMYASEQAQLVHLSRISSTNLDLDRLIIDVCHMLAEMFSMPHISIGLFEYNRHMIRYYTLSDDASDTLQISDHPIESIPEIRSTVYDTVLNPYLFSLTNEQLSMPLREMMEDQESQQLLVIPMLINQSVIGVILMGTDQQAHVNDNERRLIEMAAHQISSQIHNARIHGLTEESLIQRLEELALIEDIARQISQSLEVDSLIDNVLQAAIQATQADFASLALLNTETSQFEIIEQKVSAQGFIRQVSQQSVNTGIIGHVARTGESQIIPDNSRSNYYFGRNKDNTYASSLAVPLISRNNIIGVLNLESNQLDFFTLEQAGFVKSLAGHAAISLSNATLLEERQHQIHTLTQLRQLTLEVTTTLNQRNVISAILHTAAN
jgi:GAF domain-containing protein